VNGFGGFAVLQSSRRNGSIASFSSLWLQHWSGCETGAAPWPAEMVTVSRSASAFQIVAWAKDSVRSPIDDKPLNIAREQLLKPNHSTLIYRKVAIAPCVHVTTRAAWSLIPRPD
jgi:hypothetical protein